MEKLGYELDFVSKLKRDGKGTESMCQNEIFSLSEERFSLTNLSITNKTFVAKGFNVYIVRLKKYDDYLAFKKLTRAISNAFSLTAEETKFYLMLTQLHATIPIYKNEISSHQIIWLNSLIESKLVTECNGGFIAGLFSKK